MSNGWGRSVGTMGFSKALRTVGGALAGLGLAMAAACSPAKPQAGFLPASAKDTRPNILVITADHLGTEIGAYGDPAARTPNLDRLAREGVVFTNAYAASGSEDAETAALLTGVHPSTIGVVQEWTGAPDWTVAPPPEVKAYPELLRRAGYHPIHVGGRPDPFGAPASLWEIDATGPAAAWVEGAVGQPFVAVVDLAVAGPAAPARKKGVLDGLMFWKKDRPDKDLAPVDAARIRMPGYLPDTPETRAGLKAEYERVAALDAKVGALVARLEKAGLLDRTVIVFTSKSGPMRPRAERTVYDSGAHVPLIVRWPGRKGAGSLRRDLVSGVDLAPSLLRIGGVQPLAWMQGKDRLLSAGQPAAFAFTVQNRVDGTYERAFAVRDGRWLYVLNLAVDTPLSALARPGALTEALTKAKAAGTLLPDQLRLFSPRPVSELYDLQRDPWQLRNLAADPAYAGQVSRLAEALNLFAGSAPDFSVRNAQELGDLFKPGGQTPMAMQPTAAVSGGRLVLASISPGASILWRAKAEDPWRLYLGPISGLKGAVQAKAVRYGFQESPVATLKP